MNVLSIKVTRSRAVDAVCVRRLKADPVGTMSEYGVR